MRLDFKVSLIVGLALAALAALALIPVVNSSARSARLTQSASKGKVGQPYVPNAPRHTADASLNYWTNLYPRLSAVSAVSDTEAWAVGEYGRVARYAGDSWTDVDPEIMSGLDLADIHMTSSTDGWIAAGDRAFQYDGADWIERSDGLGSGISLDRISALGPDDVWGITRGCDEECAPGIVHWDGTSWVQVLTETVSPSDIAMVSSDEGWVLNYDPTTYSPDILHYDGLSWTHIPLPSDPDSEFDDDDLYAIETTPDGDVWVAVAVFVFSNSYYQGRVYRYSGGEWTYWDTPDHSIPYDIYMRNASQGWVVTENSIWEWDGSDLKHAYSGRYLTGVSGTSGQVWAVGAAGTILNQSGVVPWTLQGGGPTTADLQSVFALDSNNIWAVGGSVTRGGGLISGTYNTAILHYDGAWQSISNTLTGTILYDVKMVSPDEGYVVGLSGSGSSGIIAQWDSQNWTRVLTSSAVLRGLHMLGSGEGWAVGNYGSIWHQYHGFWVQMYSPVNTSLYSVVMDSPTHGWAAGGDCCATNQQSLLEYVSHAPTGTVKGWLDRTSTLPPDFPILRDLVLADQGNEGWLVGWNVADDQDVPMHPVLHLHDGAWDSDPYSDTLALNDIEPDGSGEYWAVGDCVHHYTGGEWQRVDCPSYNPLSGLAMTQDGGWAVGGRGMIMQYAPPPTATPTGTATGTPTDTPTEIPIPFSDVQPADYFYQAVSVLFRRGIISGYEDNTFRPNNSTTRGQLCKIVVLARGWAIDTTGDPLFTDVPIGSPFYSFVQTAFSHNIISGYSNATFHPGDNVTRAQLTKIVVLAMGWQIDPGVRTQFRDVPPTDPFYGFIQTAYNHQIISGYDCGTGCLEFQPGNDASRGQICKIVYLAIASAR